MGFRIKAFGKRADWNYASSGCFQQYFGLGETTKWPTHALPPIEVPLKDGRTTLMWVTASSEMPTIAKWSHRQHRIVVVPVKSSKHRCFVLCPDCNVSVPAGRTTQHKCK